MPVQIDFPDRQLRSDARLLEREVAGVGRRAVISTTRSAQARGREIMRAQSGLRPAAANRRVKSYTSKGKVWVGASPPNLLSLPDAKRVARPKAGPGGVGIQFRGQRQPGVFVPPVVGGGKVAFRRVPPYVRGAGRISRLGIEPARVLVVRQIDQAGRDAIEAAEDHARVFLPQEVERQVLVVIRERGRSAHRRRR